MTCEAPTNEILTADLGDAVQLHGDFTDEDGDYIDPSTVTLYLRKPTGEVVSFVYGTDVEVVKTATGRYEYLMDANVAGLWSYRWVSTGAGQAAGESTIRVRKPRAVP